MRKLVAIIFLITAISACAAKITSEQQLFLKDGSYLFINEGHFTSMVDKNGKPITMKDGVEMELEDGTLVMMKNKKIWRHVHRQGKRK